MLVTLKRQKQGEEEARYQSFEYTGNADSISSLLEEINRSKFVDLDGQIVTPVKWECSCLQKTCGACAMVINGIPRLACATFLRNLKGEILIEPLSKFPLVEDLTVDRSIIYENLKKAEIYQGEFAKGKDQKQLYSVAKCLKCGLCLEACPNYNRGQNFYGALFANESYYTAEQSGDRKQEIKKEYQKHVGAGCSKALSCISVCPMKIDTLASMAKLNR